MHMGRNLNPQLGSASINMFQISMSLSQDAELSGRLSRGGGFGKELPVRELTVHWRPLLAANMYLQPAAGRTVCECRAPFSQRLN